MMERIVTKEQERQALAQIREIVESLGTNSYVGIALTGCLEDARLNIENDWACSMYDRWQNTAIKLDLANGMITAYDKALDEIVEKCIAIKQGYYVPEKKEG